MSLTVTGATLDGEPVGLRCVDGTIAAIGADVVAEPGDETIDADGAPLVPTLVNGHTHAAMTLFRGYGGDLPLMRWLQERIWPVEAKLDAEDVYWGTRLACAEMIRTGTARFWDMYWQPEATARAVADAGLRATIGGPLFDADGRTAETQARVLGEIEALAELGPGIEAALAPHSIYTVSEGLLRWTASRLPSVACRSRSTSPRPRGRSRTASPHTASGPPPTSTASACSASAPCSPTASGSTRQELELIAERGATVVANPVANMKLAVGGFLPYPAARQAGVAVGLGTDGAGSNDSLDLLSDLKTFALTQRHAAADADRRPGGRGLEIATGARAPLLRGGAEPLTVGAPADFLLLRGDSPELGVGDLASDLVYAANGSIVDMTVVAGRVLMRGGEVEGVAEIVAHAAERARRLGIG